MLEAIYTIGVYGSSEAAFFREITENDIDLFCDVRMRRGLRGSQYTFANSNRLQARLAELDIPYIHLKQLAPTSKVREAQKQADLAGHVQKRGRTTLSPAFIGAYEDEVLRKFSPTEIVTFLGHSASSVVFFCVEREPAACHRALIAEYLSLGLGLPVKHLVP